MEALRTLVMAMVSRGGAEEGIGIRLIMTMEVTPTLILIILIEVNIATGVETNNVLVKRVIKNALTRIKIGIRSNQCKDKLGPACAMLLKPRTLVRPCTLTHASSGGMRT